MSGSDKKQNLRVGTNQRHAAVAPILQIVLLLVLILLLTACGRRNEEQTPTPLPTTAEEVVVTEAEATDAPVDASTVTAEALPVQPNSPLDEPSNATDQMPRPPAPEPTKVLTTTVDSNGTTAVFTPLEVDEGMECDIEPHIDLAGYPNLEQTLGCPTGEASTSPVAINEFGEEAPYDRFMLWFSNAAPEEQIYVLFPDGSWRTYPDTWTEGEPTFACNPFGGEPESPPLPRRGFGKLWCSEPELQEILGTVPREERLCQHSIVQPFAGRRLLACFEDATIRYFNILDDNTWTVIAQ